MPESRDATLLRALKFLALPSGRIAAACKRYGVTEGELRRAKKRLGPVRLTLEDLVLAGLSRKKPTQPLGLQGWLDYLDHAVYLEEQIREVLVKLVERGLAAERKGGFVIAVDWP